MRQFNQKTVKQSGAAMKFISNQQYNFDRNSHSKQSQIHSPIQNRFSGIVRFQCAIAHCSLLRHMRGSDTSIIIISGIYQNDIVNSIGCHSVNATENIKKKNTKQKSGSRRPELHSCRRQCSRKFAISKAPSRLVCLSVCP